jgi:hypothetical protein
MQQQDKKNEIINVGRRTQWLYYASFSTLFRRFSIFMLTIFVVADIVVEREEERLLWGIFNLVENSFDYLLT